MNSPQTQTAAVLSSCPECEGSVQAPAGCVRHEVLPCADCGAELEVLEVDPLRLAVAPEVEEDWGE
jgi:alpha-aminoadipate carrier protein LysW